MFRSAALALTTTTALALPACGTTNDADAVRQVMHDWWSAVAHNRPDDACDALTPAGRASFEKQFEAAELPGCRALVTGIHDWMTPRQRDAVGGINVRRILFTHHRTAAAVRDEDVQIPGSFQSDRDDRPLRLRKVGGTWKIEDFG